MKWSKSQNILHFHLSSLLFQSGFCSSSDLETPAGHNLRIHHLTASTNVLLSQQHHQVASSDPGLNKSVPSVHRDMRESTPSRLGLSQLTRIRFSDSLTLQGDPSSWSQPPVDIETKVALLYMLLTLKHNFCFDVNDTSGTI